MREFDFHPATSTAEALDLLGRYGDDAHFMAGGTSLMLMMQQGLVQPGHVVGLRNIRELRGVRSVPGGGLEIGATTTHREVERAKETSAYCPTLAENFSRIATVRIRNQATIGGNLVHADPAQDPPPMLLALDAEAVVASKSGERAIPIDGFFEDFFQTAVREGELLTAVRFPRLPDGVLTTYVKFLPRTEDDYATVSVAAALKLGTDGRCEHVRVALGSAGPTPIRAHQVEDALSGKQITPQAIDDAAELVREEVDPIDDVRGSARYKREMARVWTSRALRGLLERSNGRQGG
ncbi:MAG TPA: xanthine dehydrogenase family protein subunit M [Chloroflexota bacterium]|nr:xanthine dehydrogenase family protein subunit M [Chloroflexota bacterium]